MNISRCSSLPTRKGEIFNKKRDLSPLRNVMKKDLSDVIIFRNAPELRSRNSVRRSTSMPGRRKKDTVAPAHQVRRLQIDAKKLEGGGASVVRANVGRSNSLGCSNSLGGCPKVSALNLGSPSIARRMRVDSCGFVEISPGRDPLLRKGDVSPTSSRVLLTPDWITDSVAPRSRVFPSRSRHSEEEITSAGALSTARRRIIRRRGDEEAILSPGCVKLFGKYHDTCEVDASLEGLLPQQPQKSQSTMDLEEGVRSKQGKTSCLRNQRSHLTKRVCFRKPSNKPEPVLTVYFYEDLTLTTPN